MERCRGSATKSNSVLVLTGARQKVVKFALSDCASNLIAGRISLQLCVQDHYRNLLSDTWGFEISTPQQRKIIAPNHPTAIPLPEDSEAFLVLTKMHMEDTKKIQHGCGSQSFIRKFDAWNPQTAEQNLEQTLGIQNFEPT